jgi:hypothetical protein
MTALSARSTKKTKPATPFYDQISGKYKTVWKSDLSIWWQPYEPENSSRLGGRIQV